MPYVILFLFKKILIGSCLSFPFFESTEMFLHSSKQTMTASKSIPVYQQGVHLKKNNLAFLLPNLPLFFGEKTLP